MKRTTPRRRLQLREIRTPQPAPQLGSLCARVRSVLQKALVSFGLSAIRESSYLPLQEMALGCIHLPVLVKSVTCIGFGWSNGLHGLAVARTGIAFSTKVVSCVGTMVVRVLVV